MGCLNWKKGLYDTSDVCCFPFLDAVPCSADFSSDDCPVLDSFGSW